ncbi:hypothetical protein [Gracilimonas mengyeensis]|uniref:Uncharacterized protein n=1 Tax=Gracilimonas mengyeensis TaxID=1302730 RepID=A0A521B8S7_9BACT|nr:hypothetical protein [Gracilimonas mengyeensis]SMO43479.1 hypothetical protein SAMN06265219_102103 [Gracilimonas mengyeensis]
MIEKEEILLKFYIKIILVWGLVSIAPVLVQAQSTIEQEMELRPAKTDSAYFLGEWVEPSSVRLLLNGDTLATNSWDFDEQTGLLKIQQEFPAGSVVVVNFQSLPLSLKRSWQPLRPVEADSALFANPDSLGEELQGYSSDAITDLSNLRQSGSLSRGIIVGSNQDFSLESGLNFELSGALTENIDINASLTDQSIPIQPDGTTQNLREFDKVFIQLQAPSASVEMGDVDISLEQSTFAQLNRRLQGAAGYVESSYGDYSGAVSVVRGTYKSMNFSGQEGVQGPYRLTGRNDEEFVVILAGTERVFVNGQQVQRGADNDYVIDYGLGEITFTNKLLVKDETRIVVEYEYIDRDFNRTMVAAQGGDVLLDGRLKIGATVIRQADGDDLLSQQTLSEDDIAELRQVGDDVDQAVVSGASVATEEERQEFLLYTRVDSTINGEVVSIYEHRPGGSENIYRVRFSRVGENEGSYRRASGQANGLLYEWVGPGQGSYAPFRQLPAPQAQQMAAINGSFQVAPKIEVFGEWAVSDFDANRFSSIDDDDNTDLAYESGIKVDEVKSGIGEISARVSRRFSGDRFRYFERTREVEFDRKWNIIRTGQSREALNEAVVEVRPSLNTMVSGEIGTIDRQDFSGIRQGASVTSNEEGLLNVAYQQDWVQSEDEALASDGNWFRQNGNISKPLETGPVVITPYVRFEQENREQRDANSDSLLQVSQAFYEVGPGVRLDWQDFEINASVGYREQQAVLDNSLRDEATALEQHYRIRFSPSRFFETSNEVRLRDKTYTNAFRQEGRAGRQGLLIKSVTSYMDKKEVIDGEFFYQANTRRQALLQEAYVEVGPEIGQYVWDDLNDDGVQQIDEFFPEVSANEGTFVRQFLPSDEFFPVVDLNVRLINTIQPFANIAGDEDIEDRPWWSGMRLRSRIDIRENSTTSNLADVYLLKLNTFRNDSNTVEGRLYWEKELDILPALDVADVRIGYSENRSLNRRSSESLRNYTNRLFLSSRYDLTGRLRLLLNSETSINSSKSSRLQNRNFDIQSMSVEPGIDATVNRSWSAALNVAYLNKEDRYPNQPVTANMIKVATTHRAWLWRKVQANLRLELRNTVIDGSSSTYGNYELTEGTGEGTNLIWSVGSTYQTNSLIRFSFNYDGRTVKNMPAIHTIKLVMSATF